MTTTPPLATATEEPTVSISLSVAEIIAHVFLPINPNKMRKADPEVIKAAHAFKAAVRHARLFFPMVPPTGLRGGK